MASRRVRFAFCALMVFALWHVPVIDARAQQFGKPAAQRPQQRTQNRQAAQQNQQSARTAARPQPATSAKPQAAGTVSIEKLDPEKRKAFLKLIGANWIWSPAYT